MKRVEQRRIDYQYFPISPKNFVVGSVIGFDCYIKRFNGFVVIIDAGTTLTEELLEKVKRQEQCYVHQKERSAFARYRKEHPVEEETVDLEQLTQGCSVEELAELLANSSDPEEQIRRLYGSGVGLMRRCFEGEEKLPVEQLQLFVTSMAGFITGGGCRLEQFLKCMPSNYTEATHSLNVSLLSGILAHAAQMSRRQLEDLLFAGLLHDIGKMRLPTEILHKADTLDEEEFAKMRHHPLYSVEILKKNHIGKEQVLSAIRYHHEKHDGSGYPEGLGEERIPLMAQILCICDVFDALTTDRTFRARYSSYEALMLMKREMSHQLSVRHIDMLIRLLKRE